MTDNRICKHIGLPVGKCKLNNVQCAFPACAQPPMNDINKDVPSGVYYNVEHDNFYSLLTNKGMGNDFYSQWKIRNMDFPTTPVILEALGWGGSFSVHDPEPENDHSAIYLVCPNGLMVNTSCDPTPGLDAKRTQWMADTLNAALTASAMQSQIDKLTAERDEARQAHEDRGLDCERMRQAIAGVLIFDGECPRITGGLKDCVDNKGEPYQSQVFADAIQFARQALSQNTGENNG